MNNNNRAEEDNIALNLIDYINKGYLINCDLSSIDRILSIYFAKANENIENDQIIIDFLFNCIDKYGKNASVLFSHLDDRFDTIQILKRIHINYENKFDFSFLNPIIFKNSINLMKYNEKIKKDNMILKFFVLFLLFSTILLVINISSHYIGNKELTYKNYLTNQKQSEIEPYKKDIFANEKLNGNKDQHETEDEHDNQQNQQENIKENNESIIDNENQIKDIKEEINESINDDQQKLQENIKEEEKIETADESKNQQETEDEQKHDNEQQQDNSNEKEPEKTEENINNENIIVNDVNINNNNNVNHKKKKSKRRKFKKFLKVATGAFIVEEIFN